MTATIEAGAAELAAPARHVPRLGFLGTGWIGRHRMLAVAAGGTAQVAGICDAAPEAAADAHAALGADAADCAVVQSLDDLLALGLDGIVIASPSALHAEQSIAALEQGVAVFCQKPLGRTAVETQRVVDAARAADRLLGVDLSYRHTVAMQRVRDVVRSGALGSVYAVDLVFHNAYGPDKPWFRDKALSGGGCVMDLGIHLVDLALWTLGFPAVERASSRLYADGRRLAAPLHGVEDHAVAQLDLAGGTTVHLACSWNLHAGRDAVIEAAFHGSAGGVAMKNVNGSFYDFVAERYRGTATEVLASPPDDWGGRAAVAWARQLADGARFDSAAERLVDGAAALDAIYAGS